jgi:hypothetical protein
MRSAQPALQVKFGQSREIGSDKDTFGSIASVCEDAQGNFYVLDRIEHRVHKFSAEGRPLLAFGQKGQGPGDFQSAGRIAFSSQGELVVLEDLYYVSFFTAEGVFLKRLDLNGRLGLGYVGPDSFYGWIWRPEDKQQVILDGRNTIVRSLHTVSKDEFSVSVPEPGGRAVMFNYGPEAYASSFLFDHNGSLSALAISREYHIILLDETGREVASIRRDLKLPKLSRKERQFFERDIQETTKSKGWPIRVSREMVRKIPDFKSPIRDVRLSPEHVFVFRFGPDVTASNSPVPVDIFTVRGEFLGSAELPDVPLSIGRESMYFARSKESGLTFLEKVDYRLN